jgi:hypothetical protein
VTHVGFCGVVVVTALSCCRQSYIVEVFGRLCVRTLVQKD